MIMRCIKSILPPKIKRCGHLLQDRFYLWRCFRRASIYNKQKLILIGTPEHGNLGDHAIAKAERGFLKDYFTDNEIIEITGERFRRDINGIKRYIDKNDKIIISGGGFMGSLWPLEELMVRDVIQMFPNNKIVIFPQTIYFESNPDGERMYHESKQIYQSHDNLTICTRDRKSYDLIINRMNSNEKLKVVLVPDMVTYLNEMVPLYNRSGILLCLRQDKEKNISDEERTLIEKYVLSKGNSISYTSTVVPKRIKMGQRDDQLEKKFREFRSAELVITDRLHGMIFAAITGTPCIAMNNTSGKVLGVYNWIKQLPYICCVDSVREIPQNIERLMNLKSCEYSNSFLQKYFKEISKVIRER